MSCLTGIVMSYMTPEMSIHCSELAHLYSDVVHDAEHAQVTLGGPDDVGVTLLREATQPS